MLRVKQRDFLKIIAELKELAVIGEDRARIPKLEEGLNSNYERLNTYLNDPETLRADPDFADFHDFIKFLKDGPQLLLGTFVFIDPNQVRKQDDRDRNQMPFFLWGEEFFRGKSIKPSFQLPTLLTVRNRESREIGFGSVNPSFKKLILSINEFYRHNQPFHRQDFIRLFENPRFAKRKRSVRENELGILYVPSGEIDHCIFQLLAFHFASSRPSSTAISLDDVYDIDLCELTVAESLLRFWDQHDGSPQYREELDRVFCREKDSARGEAGCLKLRGKTSTIQSLRNWLHDWGYLEGDLPTEKLIGCIEYLHFLLIPPPENDSRFHHSSNYLDLLDEEEGAEVEPRYPRYLEGMEKNEHVRNFQKQIKPFIQNRLDEVNDRAAIDKYNWSTILSSYFGILREWVNREVERIGSDGEPVSKVGTWSERVRVRVFIHFLNRCVHGYFQPGAVEQTCRGVIFYPILRMPSALQSEEGAQNKYAGFFLCNLKDSNDEGLHFFNWRTKWTGEPDHTEGVKVDETNDFYWATIPQLQILANVLGKIETDEVFFKGILSRFIDEQRSHAIIAAISQLFARGFSHNLGSHVLINVAVDPELDGASSGHLFKYIQKRAEFIANGAVPTFYSTHSLSTEILPSFLHRAGEIERDELALLFDNISGNKTVRSENIRFLDSTSSDLSIRVDIPNGPLGFHAIYILLENIVRNSVKHHANLPKTTGAESSVELKYTITVEDAEKKFDDYYKIRVTDNFGSLNDSNDWGLIRAYLEDSILDSYGQLRKGGWGLLEMKVCAAILCGLPIENIDSAHSEQAVLINGIEQFFPPALQLSVDSIGNVVHTFYLLKPKLAAVVSSSFPEDKEFGIELIQNRDLFDAAGSRHQFAVFESQEEALAHELATNQRSVSFPNDRVSRLTEETFWDTYTRQKGWQQGQIEIICQKLDFTLEDCENRYIIFDAHTDWAKRAPNKAALTSGDQRIEYYEPVGSESPTNIAICEKVKQNEVGTGGPAESSLRSQILELAFTTVMILDERVQRSRSKPANSQHDAYGLNALSSSHIENPKYSKMFIPPLEDGTNLETLNREEVESWVQEIAAEPDFELDYLLIHRSLVGSDMNKISVERLIQIVGECRVVYISGGGVPPLLDDGYYLPFDVLNNCIGTYPCKYSLVNVLRSLRKIKRK